MFIDAQESGEGFYFALDGEVGDDELEALDWQWKCVTH